MTRPVSQTRRAILFGGSAAMAATAADAALLRLKGQQGAAFVPDLTPDVFVFPDALGAALSTLTPGTPVAPAGFNTPSPFLCTGGMQVQINGTGSLLTSGNLPVGASLTPWNTSSASNGTPVVGSCSFNGGALVVPFTVTTVAVGGSSSVTMISTEMLEVDAAVMASILAPFNDTGNRITVSVTGTSGILAANIWLMLDMISTTPSGSFVKRELLDFFCLTTLGATTGTEAGRVSFTGYTGPNGTGSLLTNTLIVNCDTAVTPPFAFGANTLARFGGVPIHKYIPGSLTGWSILTQTNSGQFELLRDATSRTELVTGKTYTSGLTRLVLAPAASNPTGLNPTTGNQSASAPYGGTPAVVPTPGASWSVTLTNGTINRIFTGTFVAGQADAAPWPLIDDPTRPQDKPITQFGYTMRSSALWTRGYTFMLEEGDHVSGKIQPGFTPLFGTTTPVGTAPAGCFAGDGLIYTAPLTPNANMITIRGRTPRTYLDRLSLDMRSIRTNSVGLRFTRFKTSVVNVEDVATAQRSDFQLFDHMHFVNLGRASYTAPADQFADRVYVTLTGANCSMISCYSRGNTGVQGADCQIIGNRFEDTIIPVQSDPSNPKIMDTLNLQAGTINRNNAVAVATVAFNCWPARQNVDDLTHCDYLQVSGGGATGNLRGYRIFGNVLFAGARRADSGSSPYRGVGQLGKFLPGAGELIFMFDLPANAVPLWEVAHNLVVDNVSHGIGMQNPQSGTKIRRNAMFDDLAYGSRSTDQALPRFELLMITGSTYSAATHNPGIYLENNMYSAAGYSTSGGILPGNSSGNLKGDVITTAWQLANLVNPTLGAAAQHIGDIIDAYSLVPGYSGPAINTHPFSDPALCDPRRHVADLATMFA